MRATPPTLGERLRHWRKQRGFSQLALAQEAGISSRHLCFVETGRASPSPEMLERIAEGLDVPLRERNQLYLLAGYAPRFEDRPLDAPELDSVRSVVDLMLRQHEPFPAFALDRYWNLVRMNACATRMLSPFVPAAAMPNAIDVYLGHPMMRQLIENWSQLAFHSLHRLRMQVRQTGGSDPELNALLAKAEGLLEGVEAPRALPSGPAFTAVLRVGDQRVKTLTTIASFSGANEVVLHDLRVELVFPVDEESANCFRAAAEAH